MTAAVSLVTFSAAGERFALPAADVREIVRAVAIAALPDAPDVVEGVVNYRGTVTCVLDIRRRFGLPQSALRPEHHFIVAQAGPRTVALWVDAATELIEVAPDAIAAPSGPAPGAKYVAGIARLADGLVVIHDLATFLSLDEAAALDHALSAQHEAGRGTP